MELREALQQISDIRQQMSRSELFRGYRSLTVGASGVLGLLAAAVQARWVEDPASDLGRYLVLWVGVAALSTVVAGVELVLRVLKSESGITRDMTRLAVEQFLPCLVVGGFANHLHLPNCSVGCLDAAGVMVFDFRVGGLCIHATVAVISVVGGFVLRRLWLCMSLLGAGRQFPRSMGDGTLFWWWSVAVCSDPLLDVGAKAWLVSQNRKSQSRN